MAKKQDDKLMVTEQVLEIRYVPSGTFIDLRGRVADYIKDEGIFPHWSIENNIVQFRDKPTKVEKEGAFAGYRNAGYFVYDADTRNYFSDKSISFWRAYQKNNTFVVPELQRIGARTKVFLPSENTFEAINGAVYAAFCTQTLRETIGGVERDVSVIVDIKEEEFDVKFTCGPMHKEEAKRYFPFESQLFEKAGFFLDLDYYRTEALQHDDVPKFVRKATELTWQKVEKVAAVLGI